MINEVLLWIDSDDIKYVHIIAFASVLMEVTRRLNENNDYFKSHMEFWEMIDGYIASAFPSYEGMTEWGKILFLEKVITGLAIQEKIVILRESNGIYIVPK